MINSACGEERHHVGLFNKLTRRQKLKSQWMTRAAQCLRRKNKIAEEKLHLKWLSVGWLRRASLSSHHISFSSEVEQLLIVHDIVCDAVQVAQRPTARWAVKSSHAWLRCDNVLALVLSPALLSIMKHLWVLLDAMLRINRETEVVNYFNNIINTIANSSWIIQFFEIKIWLSHLIRHLRNKMQLTRQLHVLVHLKTTKKMPRNAENHKNTSFRFVFAL